MDLHDRQEAEASTLYTMLLTNIELYKRKLGSLEMTRELTEGMCGPDEFNEWDEKYIARKHLKLDIVEGLVSILLFNFFNLFEEIVEHS